ncbi:3-phosphoserine/phosphohydroxythreonine transaminase [Buchnera aphidicola (Taiwanaphis decaspermi)]|uniref:3-phosphoserine/phosphohydroxythreonine transaminase n=1 Tax=Buchnera aphidicola TaxID=9 RepID=UPI0031B86341
MNKIYNFSAGPSMLPHDVLLRAHKEFLNWNNIGSSIIEISHRSSSFIKVAENTENDLRDLLNIPDTYKVLFCQGGARGQFAAVPMNLLKKYQQADYVNSGYWSYNAFIESKKYCLPNLINVVKYLKNGKKTITKFSEWKVNKKSIYIHYCPNETIEGLSIHEEPFFKNKILVGDFSSTILSKPIDINKYGIIYAGAQKNIGPSGITFIIIKKEIIKKYSNCSPSILNYSILDKYNSMFNTPPTFSLYLSGLVFKWLKSIGGLNKIYKINKIKANLLYDYIDKSYLYTNNIAKKNRSIMNVTFKLKNEKLNNLFIKNSVKQGLYALKGHKILGGMRASIYNAMPIKGVKKLIKYMNKFEKKYT